MVELRKELRRKYGLIGFKVKASCEFSAIAFKVVLVPLAMLDLAVG